ncbi:MAG: ABC transporter permease [bacterium]|nr:ABC transporter permease [bacterium]
MEFRLVRAHVVALLRDLLRTPSFLIPTVGFPTMFYCIFALGYARTNADTANFIVCSYVGFAMLGVTLFQFGVGVANERGRPWERYLRALPVSVATRFAARVIVALIFGAASAGLVGIVARLLSPVTLDAAQWFLLALAAVFGAIPFVLIGLAIAYWVPARGALPVTNLLYLLGLFAGGFFMPPQYLPSFAQAISPYTPTRQFGELLWSVTGAHDAPHAMSVLVLYALAFAAIAIIGYRRDERTRYA